MLKDTTKVVNFSNQFMLLFLFSAFKSASHFLWSLRDSTNHCTEKKEHSNTGGLLKICFDLLACSLQNAICFVLSISKKMFELLKDIVEAGVKLFNTADSTSLFYSHPLRSHVVGLKLTIMSIKMSCWTV